MLGYDTTGQIIWQRYRHGSTPRVTQNYSYDRIGQLTEWTDNRVGSTDITYSYDQLGNRQNYGGTGSGSYTYITGRNRTGIPPKK